MKKLLAFIICLMAIVVSLTSCGNIDEEVNTAFEQCEKYSEQCASQHAEDDAKYLWEAVIKKNKVNADSVIRALETDADLICNKCFGSIFERYGETKTIVALNNYVKRRTYKNIEVTCKEVLYVAIKKTILESYEKKRESLIETKTAEYKLKMINKQINKLRM